MFFRAVLAGEGETKIPMIIGLIGTISNVILDPIFIFLLEYGVDGAAIATVLSQAIMLAMYFTIIFVMKKTFISFNFSHFRYTPNILGIIFKVGIPSSLSMLIMSFGQAVLNKILINYSSESVAAYQIVSRIDMLLFMPCLGIAIALTTIVGMFFGAREFSKLVWIIKYGISRAFMITIVNVVILFLSAEIILPIFTSNQEVLSVGITYLRIIVLVYPAVAVSVICARICQAFGQGMPLLIVTTIRVLVITAPLSIYFYQTGKPVVWVWYSQVLAIVIAASISFLFLQYYLRKFHIVGDTSNS
jgi:putative MATE family efflux protein